MTHTATDTARSAPAQPTPAALHVVAPGDAYERNGQRCARCHRAVIACDVITINTASQTRPTITHYDCLTVRAKLGTPGALAPTDPSGCWYGDSRTLSPCPLTAYNHNLCRSHHEQLCCSKKPK